ncbi:MAG: hypothetical protein U1E25_01415 [Methylocystis sp.]
MLNIFAVKQTERAEADVKDFLFMEIYVHEALIVIGGRLGRGFGRATVDAGGARQRKRDANNAKRLLAAIWALRVVR